MVGSPNKPGDLEGVRAAIHSLRPVDLHEAAAIQHRDPVTERHGLAEVLRDVQHGRVEGLEEARQLEAHLVA